MFRVGQKFLAFGGRTVENARYRDLNSDIPVCLSTELAWQARLVVLVKIVVPPKRHVS